MSATFGLVHLSDLHFATKPNRLPSPVQSGGLAALFDAVVRGHRGNWFKPATHSTRAARAVARYLRTTLLPQESPDAVVVSGDMAATGDLEDLIAARDYVLPSDVEGWANRDEEPRLSVGEAKLLIVPGNHDRYCRGTLFPGSSVFEEVFQDLWSPCAECDRVSEPVLIRKQGEVLGLISADFTLRTVKDGLPPPLAYIGRGKVYDDVVDALIEKTRSLQQLVGQAVAVVWVVHFPPQFPGVDSNLALIDETKLLAAASEADVRILLAGHTHEDRVYSANDVTVSCVGSATQAEADSTWHFSLNEFIVENGVILAVQVHPFRYEKAGRNNFVRGQVIVI